jgi:branched-chain amino acid transport system substrate-binding protein
VPIISIEWTDEDAKIAGDKGEGLEYITEVFQPSDENPWSQHFYKAYKEKYDAEPDIYAANYYEGTYVIAELIRRARAHGDDYWSGDKLYDAIWEDPVFKSVYNPTMKFNEKTGVAAKPVALFEVGADGSGKFQRYLQVD